MTMFFITCLDQHGQFRKYSFGGISLEAGFELLSGLTRKGEQLITVEVVDSGKAGIQLPVAAFDGAPFTEPIKRLEREWKAVLMAVNEEEDRLWSAVNLLQAHLNQLSELAAAQLELHSLLKEKHNTEKVNLASQSLTTMGWAQLLTRQSQELTELITNCALARQQMLARHQHEKTVPGNKL